MISKHPKSEISTTRSKKAPKRLAANPLPTQVGKKRRLAADGQDLDSRPDSKASQRLQVYVCGEGSSGELGLGAGPNVIDVRRARENPRLNNVTCVATGGMHAVAITLSNELLTWGVNDNGALGRNTQWEAKLKDIGADESESEEEGDLNPREATPTAVPSSKFPLDTSFAQISAGDSTTFVVTSQGAVYGWGTFRDHNGVYGFTLDRRTSQLVKYQREPALIPNLKDVIQVSAGADYALALDNRGRVFAWGCGQQCELGRRLLDRRRKAALLPTRVEIPRKYKIRSIHAASNHAFAIDEHGDTWAWGLNNFGQTGIVAGAGQPEAIIAIPTRVPALVGKNMKLIAGGLHHSVGLSQSGECLFWGRLDGGQSGLDVQMLMQNDSSAVLMDDLDKPRVLLRPTALPIPQCIHVAAGSDHCLAVTFEGTAYSWGFNATNQCGQGTDDDIPLATPMESKGIRGKQIVWAGAGGQYSMLASNL